MPFSNLGMGVDLLVTMKNTAHTLGRHNTHLNTDLEGNHHVSVVFGAFGALILVVY